MPKLITFASIFCNFLRLFLCHWFAKRWHTFKIVSIFVYVISCHSLILSKKQWDRTSLSQSSEEGDEKLFTFQILLVSPSRHALRSRLRLHIFVSNLTPFMGTPFNYSSWSRRPYLLAQGSLHFLRSCSVKSYRSLGILMPLKTAGSVCILLPSLPSCIHFSMLGGLPSHRPKVLSELTWGRCFRPPPAGAMTKKEKVNPLSHRVPSAGISKI